MVLGLRLFLIMVLRLFLIVTPTQRGNLERKYLEGLILSTEVKPFGHTFDEQLDACEELYGTPLQFNFIDVKTSELCKYYDDEVLARIDFVLGESKRKYEYLFKSESRN